MYCDRDKHSYTQNAKDDIHQILYDWHMKITYLDIAELSFFPNEPILSNEDLGVFKHKN